MIAVFSNILPALQQAALHTELPCLFQIICIFAFDQPSCYQIAVFVKIITSAADLLKIISGIGTVFVVISDFPFFLDPSFFQCRFPCCCGFLLQDKILLTGAVRF